MNVSREVRREDILVSICLSDIEPTAAAYAQVAEFARMLDARFRFREIVLVAKSSEQLQIMSLMKTTANLRLFIVRDGLSSYEERVVAAAEAIGDVVLVASLDQFESLDHVGMIEAAAADGQIVVGLRPEPRGLSRVLSLLLSVVGSAAGFRTGLRDGPTMAIPRTLLNQLLEHSDPDLAMRFIPRDPVFPVATVAPKPSQSAQRQTLSITQRLGLIEKLVLHMAPRILPIVALAAALLTCLGLVYTVYTVVVFVLLSTTQPGWVTISMIMGLTATFLGASILGLSIGIQRLLSLMRHRATDSVAREVNSVDLFGQVASELNVDRDRALG
jgi:hypothetical protein